jgi:hypothetical protein
LKLEQALLTGYKETFGFGNSIFANDNDISLQDNVYAVWCIGEISMQIKVPCRKMGINKFVCLRSEHWSKMI